MAERIERYLETAGAQVRWKRVRPALKRELRTHLEEQTEAYLAEGMTEDAAEAEAVRQMGDAEAVGLALDAVHRPKKQTAILLFAGIAIVLGMYLRAELIGSSYAFTLAAGLLACGALIGGYYLDYRCLSRYAWYIYGAVLVLGAVCVYQTTFMGPGAPCMLGITVGDTSEYAALLYPAAYALVVYVLRGKKGGFWLSLAALTPFATLLLLDRYGKLMYRIVFAAGAAAVLLSAIRVELFRVKKNWARALVWTLLVLAIAGLLYMDSQQYHNFSNWYLSPAGLREWRAIMQEYHRNSSTVSALLERGELAEANRLGRLVGTPAWVWLAMLYAPQAGAARDSACADGEAAKPVWPDALYADGCGSFAAAGARSSVSGRDIPAVHAAAVHLWKSVYGHGRGSSGAGPVHPAPIRLPGSGPAQQTARPGGLNHRRGSGCKSISIFR